MGKPGGYTGRLNISSIRIRSTSSNLGAVIKCMTVLDIILGGKFAEIPETQNVTSTLKHLFSAFSSDGQRIANKYVENTFQSFMDHKDTISINFRQLKEQCKNKDLLDLFCTEIVRVYYDHESKYAKRHGLEDDKLKQLIVTSNQNMLKPYILKLFKNVTCLEFYSMDLNSKWYPFSLESLLSLIIGTNIKKVKITGHGWLRKLRDSTSWENISKQYQEANFSLDYAPNHVVTITYDP